MARYGYARVSTIDQDLRLQEAALRAASCNIVRAEKVSGTMCDGRAELALLLTFLRPGDTLVVTRIDRLARSIKDLQDIVETLKQRGATLMATEQPIDTTHAAGKAFLDMLGVFAEFETNLRRERQLEGIAAAKGRGCRRSSTSTSTCLAATRSRYRRQSVAASCGRCATPSLSRCAAPTASPTVMPAKPIKIASKSAMRALARPREGRLSPRPRFSWEPRSGGVFCGPCAGRGQWFLWMIFTNTIRSPVF